MLTAWAQNSAQPPTCGARLGLSSGRCALRSLLKRPERKPVTVVSLEVAERGRYQGGTPFGETGPYEYLAGIMHFTIDPRSSANQFICDVDLAPTNAQGQVEFSARFHLLKPIDPCLR